MLKLGREGGRARQGEHQSSADVGVDPEGSWGAAGRQSKILVLFSCKESKLQQPKWCGDECDEKTLLELLKILSPESVLGAGFTAPAWLMVVEEV